METETISLLSRAAKRWQLFVQFLREYWIPAIAAMFWVAGIAWLSGNKSIAVLLTSFSASFFFLSWIWGHTNRIDYQRSVAQQLASLSEQLKLVQTAQADFKRVFAE